MEIDSLITKKGPCSVPQTIAGLAGQHKQLQHGRQSLSWIDMLSFMEFHRGRACERGVPVRSSNTRTCW